MVIKSHRVRTKIITASAVIVIFVALVFSLFRFAIPHITNYGETIEAELGRQLGMLVKIESVDADIRWLTPRLNLLGVKIYDRNTQRPVFTFREINLSLDWEQSFRNLTPELGFVSLVGLDLHLQRQADGKLNIQGYPFAANGSNRQLPQGIFRMLEKSSIYVIDSTLHWTDNQHNAQELELTNVNLALLNDAPGHKLSIEMEMPEQYGRYLRLIFDIEGPLDQMETWKGKIYAGVRGLRLKKWLDDYWQQVDFNGGGIVDANVWLEWDQKTISQINGFVDASDMSLNYLDRDVRSWKLDHFKGNLRWTRHENGWSVDMRNLQMERNKQGWPEPAAISVTLDEANRLASTQATFVRLEDVAYLGGLVTRFLPIKDFDWNKIFDIYRPHGDLYEVSLRVPLDEPDDAIIDARFKNLGYQTGGDLPAATGLDGSLSYDGSATLLQLDSHKVELTFKDLFRYPLSLQSLVGKVRLQHRDNAWHVSSEDLRLATAHLATRTRLDIRIPKQGAPFVDLVTRVSDGDGSQKSLYLPTAIMPRDTVEWLDRAIVKADIPQGGFLFYGSVDDYPFDRGEGVMQALFDVEQVQLKYLADWPAVEDMRASIQFYNRALHIENARGRILGADFYNTRLDIADLHKAHLDIKGDVDSPLPELLNFIRQSPLNKNFGDYFTGLQTGGPARLALNLQIPLVEDKPTQVSGRLQLKDNQIFFSEQDYRLEQLKGVLSFSENAVNTETLTGQMDGHDLDITLATVDDGQAKNIHIGIAGEIEPKSLLKPFPGLVDYVDGSADFKVNIDIPRDDKHKLLNIGIESDLQGLISTFPGCYGKSAQQAGDFNLAVDLYKNDDLQLNVHFDETYKVEARRERQKWLVRVDSRDLVGNVRFMQDIRKDIPIQVNIDYIDLGELLMGDQRGSVGDVSPMDIPPLRVQIRKLDWKDYKLADIGLETERSDEGMRIQHFEIHAPTVNIMGKGSWLSSWRHDDATVLDFTLDTHDLGATLSQFNITEAIRKTDGRAIVHWTWPAKPYQFDWNILRGRAHLDLEDGQFSDIDVGAGRLIGILNFETLLSLDFGNQVSSGFAFDQLSGDIRFDAGNAYTNEVTIESKVAEIILDGRIGLSAEDYDQTITVIPGVGSTLTVIGAVTGGPVTAAAVHLFRKLFGIDRIAKYEYAVTGSWNSPEVRLLSAPEEENTSEKSDDQSL